MDSRAEGGSRGCQTPLRNYAELDPEPRRFQAHGCRAIPARGGPSCSLLGMPLIKSSDHQATTYINRYKFRCPLGHSLIHELQSDSDCFICAEFEP